uniref:3-deoxy-D-manno-octulosonic acid transferase n=1 Tax=uncultured Thiotrichaceae bacterium TaxID=298394 RepID=A0A6S6UJ06_9GAMM|nr:MAG: Lipid IVA 3-deoxy-D-manno-octulosonic acid transferase (EC [often with (EC also] [uncultured Thiotrichaceae bacterium]
MSWRRILYTMTFYLLLPVLLGRLLWKGRNNKAYRQRWQERLGFVSFAALNVSSDESVKPVICLHVVSVGETVAARPLVEQLLAQFPAYTIWITSMTPTGSDTVLRLFGDRVEHSYLPYDTPGAVRRFIRRVNPSVFLIMETEIWPNLFAACSYQQIPLLLINARLSERSVRRYQRIRDLVGETLRHVTGIMARSEQDAEHFHLLGARAVSVEVVGDIKFDLFVDEHIGTEASNLRKEWGQRPVWCAGSTHDGEDALILEVHLELRKQYPGLLLILVPRHPERFGAVAGLCREAGANCVLRSSGGAVEKDTAVLLGDTMGELLLWYAASDVAFVGGSMVPVGGHNPLEALHFSTPVLSGRHVHNFADLYPVLVGAGAVRLVDSTIELRRCLSDWLADHEVRGLAGQAGRQLLSDNRGVTTRLLEVIHTCLNRV